MKKIILIILSLFSVLKVNAMTYYSDYNNTFVSDMYIEPTDILDVEEKEVYELYEDEISYAYLKESNYRPTGNTIKEYTEWTKDASMIDFNKSYEAYYEYIYVPAKNYNYFSIKNAGSDAHIKYLKIYDPQFDNTIYEGNFKGFMGDSNVLPGNTSIIYRLTNKTNLANLEITMEFEEKDVLIQIYASDDYPSLCNPDLITQEYSSFSITDFSKYEVIYPSVKINVLEKFERPKKTYNVYNLYYRNVEEYYEYEIVNRKYLGIYSDNPEDNIDYERKKTLYTYRLRDKVVINDNINDYENIILFTTTDDISITNIDNKVLIKLPFLDDTLEYEKKDILKELEYSNYLVDKKNLEIKELVEYQDSYTDNIVDDLNSCYTENKILKDEKQVLTEEKEVKQSSLYYILIILIITVILTICRIMSSKNNNNFCRK